jgi:hypothetical protein
MRPFVALAIALFIVAGVACSGNDASPASPGTAPAKATEKTGASGPTIQPAPDARLRDSTGRETVTPAGTRCWGGGCVDMIGPLTWPYPTVMRPGEALTVAFDAGQPTTAQFAWVSGPRKQTAPVNRGLVAWEPAEPAGGQTAKLPLRAPEAPGDYLLTVFATWQGKGDISYAWYLRVE